MSDAVSGPALELRGVHVRIGASALLRGVDLTVRRGERVAVIGPNGAGKSTLLDSISGRLAHARTALGGQIWLDGQRIDGQPPHRINRLGLARSFQITSLFARLPVFENLRCAALWRAGGRYAFCQPLSRYPAARARADELLHRLNLQDWRDVPAAHLPYARQRALELGMTLVSGASVILLDEPTAGMDRAESARFTALIRDLTADLTLLIVEHDMDVVLRLANRIAVLDQGRILAFGTPEAVRADPRVQATYPGLEAGAPC